MDELVRDGVKLAYVEAGKGRDGTVPLVFVPGGSCDWWSFSRQLEHFGDRHHSISVDLRGHGQSDKPSQAYSPPVFADDVAWLIDRLGIDRPVVIGHSMGGAIALQLEADHPGHARALVLVDPAPVTDNRAGFEQILASFERFGVDSTRRRMFRNFFLPGYDEALLAEVCERAAALPDEVFRAEIEGMRDWDGAAAARACTIPVLHIAAARPTCPPATLAEAIPQVVTGQTVGAGHFNMLEVPEQVNSMLAHFLRMLAA
jgi:pimeloyl-ACP methyl ester carboxylesterase